MKRFCIVLLVLSLLVGSAAAGDWSGYSVEELRALVLEINAEIVGRDGWEGVNIPAGIWTVGVDIPVGDYSFTLADSRGAYVTVRGGESWKLIVNSGIRRESQEIWKVRLEEGYTVEVDGGTIHLGLPRSLGF